MLFFVFQKIISPTDPQQYVCPVNETGDIILHQPELTSRIGRDIKYLLRPDGSFVPRVETVPATIDGHTYSLKLTSDKQYVNPYPGEKIKFTIKLLRDGKPAKSMPTDENGNPIFKYIQPVLNDGWSTYTLSSSTNIKNYIIDQTSSIYSAQTIYLETITEGQKFESNYIDMSSGQAEFYYIHNGFGNMAYGRSGYWLGLTPPYLDFQILAGNKLWNGIVSDKQLSTNKVLCFIDMFTDKFDIPKPDIQQGEEIYYEMNVKPVELFEGRNNVIKISVISRYTKNNKINTNPLQRVQVGIIDPARSGVGDFIGAKGGTITSTTDKQILDESIRHSIDIKTGSTLLPRQSDEGPLNLLLPLKNYASIDLINGKGTVYFAFTGYQRFMGLPNVAPFIYFIVHPTSFVPIVIPTDTNSSVLPNRVEQNIAIPTKPDDNKQYYFLYEKWYEPELHSNPLMNEVYTIISVPINSPDLFSTKVNFWPIHLIWLATLQSVIAVIGAGMIVYFRYKPKVNIQKQKHGR